MGVNRLVTGLGKCSVGDRKAGKKASREPAQPAVEPPLLPPDLLIDIAKRALEAEGCSLEALWRLNRVCVAWRKCMKGENSIPCCGAPLRA